MTTENDNTIDLLKSITENLELQNNRMLELRDSHCGSETQEHLEAALAVDDARNKIAQALHCLRRCETRLNEIAIEVGKTYIHTDPQAWPKAMYGASVTVTGIDRSATKDQLAVVYSFIDTSGCTGDGTMQLSHAKKFLRTEDALQDHERIHFQSLRDSKQQAAKKLKR